MLKLSKNSLTKDAKHEISELLTEYHARAENYRNAVTELKDMQMQGDGMPGLEVQEVQPGLLKKVMRADEARAEWGETAQKIQAWFAEEERLGMTIIHNDYLHAVTPDMFVVVKVDTIVDVTGC